VCGVFVQNKEGNKLELMVLLWEIPNLGDSNYVCELHFVSVYCLHVQTSKITPSVIRGISAV